MDKLEIFDLFSELIKIRFNENAESKFKKMILLIRGNDIITRNLGKIMLHKVFDDYLLSSYLFNHYNSIYFSSTIAGKFYKEREEQLENNLIIGFKVYKYFTKDLFSYSNPFLLSVNKMDKTQFKKYKKRIELSILKLEKFNKKYK